MRRVIWLIVLMVLVWSGWWAVATYSALRAMDDWLTARQSEGWQADASTVAFEGYPFDIRITLKDLAIADPGTSVAVHSGALTFEAPAWNPGHLTVLLPDDPVHFASPQGQNRLLTQNASALLDLQTNAALAVEQMQATADAWVLEATEGDVLAGGATRTTFVKIPETQAKYRFTMSIDALRPGTLPRAALFIPEEWPVTFDRFALQSTVRFDRPWDITALEVSRPQPREIIIDQAEAVWGALQLRFAAALNVDAAGAASGTVSVQARNWRSMLILAENGGVLPPGLRPQIERALSTFAGLGGNSESLDLTLTLRDGFISLGFLPLGQAPRLILR